jgi:hypothetical protein
MERDTRYSFNESAEHSHYPLPGIGLTSTTYNTDRSSDKCFHFRKLEWLFHTQQYGFGNVYKVVRCHDKADPMSLMRP